MSLKDLSKRLEEKPKLPTNGKEAFLNLPRHTETTVEFCHECQMMRNVFYYENKTVSYKQCEMGHYVEL